MVDLETGQPIEGAVALAVWWEVVPTPVQGNSRFYDGREAVTGPDGRFEIARGVPFWNLGVQPPAFYLFAPGYQVHADIVTPPDGQPLIDPTIVQMRRLRTREERIDNLRRYSLAGVPEAKKSRLLEAVSRERVALGLSP